MAVFAGLWTPHTAVRTLKTGEESIEVFGFLTTTANNVVAAVHPKAMPVILTTPDEIDTWLQADWPEARARRRPLPDDALTVVARGPRKDGDVAV